MSIRLMHHPLAARRLRRADSPARQVGGRARSATPRHRGAGVAAFADGLLSSIAAAATGHLTGI